MRAVGFGDLGDPCTRSREPGSGDFRLAAGFVEDPPITGFDAPIAFDWTPDGRMFVGEKGGKLRVVKNGVLLPTPALSLSVNSDSERGLLGVVLDPQFASRPYIYLYYTTGPGSLNYGGSPKNRVSRFTVEGDTADLAGERILVDNIPSDAGNHNAGDLHFGPDGMLYASTGDGGSNSQNAQDLRNLAGKILRIDPESGQTYEEINRLDPQSSGPEKPGANYGWPQVEGPDPPGVAGTTYPSGMGAQATPKPASTTAIR